MKNFITFLILICVFLSYLSYKNILSKTRSGERQEPFKSLTSQNLPPILANYLADRNIRYSLYKIPNNVDYSSVYKVSPKYTIILFAPVEKTDSAYAGFSVFYPKLLSEAKLYNNNFNILYNNRLSYDDLYNDPYDKVAFEQFRKHCNYFCLIDPSKDTLFTFKNITISETEALEVLFQQYSFLMK